MTRQLQALAVCLAIALGGCESEAVSVGPADPATLTPPDRPNILLIVIDDVGFSDLGVYGSEIRTPHIDSIARRGLTFTDFHVGMTCSPTRAMMLTGVDNHLAGLGNMAGVTAQNQLGQPGYEGHLNDQVVPVPEILQASGYRTYMAGKWHLGYDTGYRPVQQGFDHSFALLNAGASHFNDMRGLIERSARASYLADDEPVESLPPDFFSSTFYVQRMIDFIQADEASDAPFFAYLAFTAPHWPLGVPDEYLDLYQGDYDEGYDIWRQRRLDSVNATGILDQQMTELPRLDGVAAWDDLPPEVQKRESRKMELYAAMIEHLDMQIGRLLDYLADAGMMDNTAILLMSDNGSEGNDRSRIATNAEWLPRAWDLSYENMGKKDSYVYYGAGWGQVSSAPFRLFKAYPAEGGTRVPLIVSLPGQDTQGATGDTFATVVDIAPTLLQLAGIPVPEASIEEGAMHEMQGTSLLPYVEGQVDRVHDPDYAFGWELFGHRAVRKGPWKLLWIDDGNGQGEWQLYNLVQDPAETNDLSGAEPEKLAEMIREWSLYVERNGVILPDGGQDKAFGY